MASTPLYPMGIKCAVYDGSNKRKRPEIRGAFFIVQSAIKKAQARYLAVA